MPAWGEDSSLAVGPASQYLAQYERVLTILRAINSIQALEIIGEGWD